MKIAIVTGTRADWGLLSPVARRLNELPEVEVQVIATNMHLNPLYGNTKDEIRADGFEIAAEVPMNEDDDTRRSTAKAMAGCAAGMADALDRLNPDMLLILGDRYEMLAVASVATVMCIPIIHIAGGEISEGAIDDNIRHAITKLSALHLVATEPYRRRVIAMGEQPDRVVNTGAIGVHNIHSLTLLTQGELAESLGFEVDGDTLLVTLHPTTRSERPTAETVDALIEALDRFPDKKILFTYPNNDADGRIIIDRIERYAASDPQRVRVVPSLGRMRYLSALQFVGAVVGNSSSGIVEVPSMKIPTVNIGIRQRGRIAAGSVIDCGTDAESIAEGIEKALSEEFRRFAATVENPYYKPDTLNLMVDAIRRVDPSTLLVKRFYDIPYSEL
ncbi:MAG: UDP-N-acetylglucosamine 2-epimerase (hydrolyzing) [Muribaculaceae bacterium]|nr:UDP-N-acetylglucosamine 2-epimerase (hydrolyzing) [Muribaculaceae bacterium]